ncbi:MAG: hypothetical protein ACUVWX_07785 [Kiritimatiellia bacterium]
MGNSGSFTIGHWSDPAGSIRIDFIRTGCYYNKFYSRGNGGAVNIYGNSYVRIMDAWGNLGDIITWSYGYDGGGVTLIHDGEFVVRNINAESGSAWSGGAKPVRLTLDGDLLGDGPSGMCYISGYITNAQTRCAYGANGEILTIRGYTNVTILGNISSFNATPNAYNAANIYITNITGDITIWGAIDANAANGDTLDGDLKLWCSGTIRLDGLNLSRVKTAQLYANGHSYIRRDLLLPYFPVSQLTSKLDAKTGQRIYYAFWPNNLYLGGATYNLSSRGQLMPNPASDPTAENKQWMATGGNFELGRNWAGGSPPADDFFTHMAIIGSSTSARLAKSRSVAGLRFTGSNSSLLAYSSPYTTHYLMIGQQGLDSIGSGANTIAAGIYFSLDALGDDWNAGPGSEWDIAPAATVTLAGPTAGEGYLSVTGGGKLKITAASTRTGSTGIMDGVLDVEDDNGLDTTTLILGRNGQVNFLSSNPGVGSLGNGDLGHIVLGKAGAGGNDTTLTIGLNNAPNYCNAAISDATGRVGSLVKVGFGKQILDGTNTFSGSITVNGGMSDGIASGYLEGWAQAAGSGASPFGSSSGSVTLNRATLSLHYGTATTAREPVSKGTLTYTGVSRLMLTSQSTANPVQMTFANLVRGDGTYPAALRIKDAAALGTREIVKVTSPPPNMYGIVPPYMLREQANSAHDFMAYDSAKGFVVATNYVTYSGAGPYQPPDNSIANFTASCTITSSAPYAIRFTAQNMTIAKSATVTIGSGGLSTYSYSPGNILAGDGNSVLNFGANEALICLAGTGSMGPQVTLAGTGGLTKFGTGNLSFGSSPTKIHSIGSKLTVLEGYINIQNVTMATMVPNMSELVLDGGGLDGYNQNCTINIPTITIGPRGGIFYENSTGGSVMNVSGNVVGPGEVRLTSYGTVRFSGAANTWTGGLSSWSLTTVDATSSLGTGPVTAYTGCTLTLNGTNNIASSARLTLSGGTVYFRASGNTTSTIGSLAGFGTIQLGPISGTTLTRLRVGSDNTSTTYSGVIG